MLKLNQKTFVHDVIIEESLIKYNVNVILIKTGFSIEIIKFDNYKEMKL